MVQSKPSKDVDSYLSALPPDVKAALQKLRKQIKRTAPDAEELISYRIPAYKYHGRYLIFFAAFKDHCSIVPVRKDLLKRYSKELTPFKVSGYTIHFTPEKPLPASLVTKLVKARMKENEERARAR